jgi:hypothetical protein
MASHQIAPFQPYSAIAPVIVAALYVFASSLIREPARRNFNAIMIAGAGAAYLGGGFGIWELVFCAIVTACAYNGLRSYRYIGIGWLLHSGWDVMHHLYGNPIIPFLPMSSAGCAITDAVIAVWFLADAPSLFDFFRPRHAAIANQRRFFATRAR